MARDGGDQLADEIGEPRRGIGRPARVRRGGHAARRCGRLEQGAQVAGQRRAVNAACGITRQAPAASKARALAVW